MVEQTVYMKQLRAAAPHRAQYKMKLGAQPAEAHTKRTCGDASCGPPPGGGCGPPMPAASKQDIIKERMKNSPNNLDANKKWNIFVIGNMQLLTPKEHNCAVCLNSQRFEIKPHDGRTVGKAQQQCAIPDLSYPSESFSNHE